MPLRVFEIGVQNGGSLEIWAKYFAQAELILGCDINEACGDLEFEDSRISVIVGDVTREELQAKILRASSEFDIIIDDGSHASQDIIQSFCKLFPTLAEGGIYIIEDLHCSYWAEYGGGLYHPYSAVAFLKKLTDVVNREHWGLEKKAGELLEGFNAEHGVEISDQSLRQIHTVEFTDSLCIIRKLAEKRNSLGKRIIAGKSESVIKGHLGISENQQLAVPPQASNPWSSTGRSLNQELQLKNAELEKQAKLFRKLRRNNIKHESQIKELSEDIRKRDLELYRLRQSVSWRMTAPLRRLWKFKYFDEKYYLEQYPDVARAGVDPFKHYENQGRMEGRKPGPRRKFSDERSASKKSPDSTRKENALIRLVRHLTKWPISGDSKSVDGPYRNPQPAINPNDYAEWIKRFDSRTQSEREHIKNAIDAMEVKPIVSIIMPTYNTKIEWLEQAVNSVRTQLYENWELCIADDASTNESTRQFLAELADEDPRVKVVFREDNGHISEASNSALEISTGDWVALMDHDDLLPEHALYEVAKTINCHPDATLIYSDEDKIDEDGRRSEPYFKCDWNPDLFLSHNMISHLGVYRRELTLAIGGFRKGFEGSQDHDLALRYIEKIDQRSIVHIPKVLYHWRMHSDSTAADVAAKPYAVVAGENAIQEHFDRCGISATVEGQLYGYRIFYDLPQPEPLVTLIIPTRNQLNLLQNCIESIQEKTLYSNFEILVVDNNSDDPDTLTYLELINKSPGIRVQRDTRPFNFAEINNSAVHDASGELVALVNNDIEVISSDWLGEMVSIACQPGVGAVGAKLLYPDETVQHAGVVLGLGGIGCHAFKNAPGDAPGYFGRARIVNTYSALTAACMVLRKSVFQEVGGLDGNNLAIAFNDVDFCLRLSEAGYRNVWTPHALLYHHESVSRGQDDSPEKRARFEKEVEYMKSRWGDLLQKDPAYSPNLTLHDTDFSFAWPPRNSD